MRKIGIYLIIFLMVLLFRENISFFYGNILGVFKLDNNYYKSIIELKNREIDYLKEEYKEYDEFSKNIKLLDYNYKLSKILYKESYNTNIYKIQYGKKDKVKIGLGVINEFGLVGKITDINKIDSTLTTIRDLKDISVVVNDSYGKLNYDCNLNQFIITDISNYDKVFINDKVYTSGYGTINEKLYIGKVTRVENDSISKKIYVESLVNFNDLNYLLIVGDF